MMNGWREAVSNESSPPCFVRRGAFDWQSLLPCSFVGLRPCTSDSCVHRYQPCSLMVKTGLALCVDIGIGGIFLDELAARFYVVAHQHGENLVGISGILDGYLFQQACLGIHGRLP